MATALVERFDGEVPGAMEDLVTLPGVGRKTANVVRSVALDLPGLPVDTHVLRLSRRLGLTTQTDPVKVERELNAMIPPAKRGTFSLRLILHGRRGVRRAQPPMRRLRAQRLLPRLVRESVPLSSTDAGRVTASVHGEGLQDRGNPVVSKSQPGSRHLVPGDAGIRRLVSPRETAPSGAVSAFWATTASCGAQRSSARIATSSRPRRLDAARARPRRAPASTSSRAPAGVPLDRSASTRFGELLDSGRRGQRARHDQRSCRAGTRSVSRNVASNLRLGTVERPPGTL